jgi:hypothetical protein
LCCLFACWRSFPNFCNYWIMIRITVSSSEGLYIEGTWMPSPVCQYVIKLSVSLTISRGLGLWTFWCGNIVLFNN